MENGFVNKLAFDLMDYHGLSGWDFEINRGKYRLGLCSYVKKTIFVSGDIIPINDKKAITEVLLHEIAHALVGRGNGHNRTWKNKAIEIGSTGSRIIPDWVNTPPMRYLATCPNGHTTEYENMPKGNRSCGRCSNYYDVRYLFTFKPNPKLAKKGWYN